jgi:hypothetical protein
MPAHPRGLACVCRVLSSGAHQSPIPVSVPTAELSNSPVAARGNTRRRLNVARLDAGMSFYLVLGIVALVIGLLSLEIPSTPSYDPWSWLVWGREIIHGNLQVSGGPSWKPLPMIFTTVFALFGHVQPDMWLVIARAGAVATVVMVFRLTWILTRGLVGGDAEDTSPGLWLVRIACLFAAVIAAGSVVNSPGFISNNALGYSEGLATAVMLMAVDSYIDGHRHRAFVFGFITSLDRPELWVFWMPFGIWLAWRDPGARKLVAILFVATLALWFGPAGFSGVTRANNPRSNSAAFTSCPVCTVFRKEAWPTLLNRVKIPGVIGLLTAAALLFTTRTAWWRRGSLTGAAKWRIWLLIIGVFGFVWWLGIGIETQLHFSGNARYLVFGTVPLAIASGAAWGWLMGAIPALLRWLGGRLHALDSLARSAGGGAVAAVVPLVVFLAWPPWIGNNIISLPRTHHALVYQAHLREDLNHLIKLMGGRKAVLDCGTVMAEGFQVPMVAWTLDVPILRVEAQPAVNKQGFAPPPWPNTIFQDQDTGSAALLPQAATIVHWVHDGAHYVTYDLQQRTFRVFSTCPAKVSP